MDAVIEVGEEEDSARWVGVEERGLVYAIEGAWFKFADPVESNLRFTCI